MPTVSVIIPTYNYSNFIVNAIESVLNQDYPQSLVQIIVIDDGSKDNTKEVLNSYISSNRIEYYYQENRGKASATMLGINKSKGEFIFNLDADDIFYPNKLSTTISIYNKFSDVVFVTSPADIVFQDKSFSVEPVPKFLLESVNSGDYVLRYFLENNLLFGGGSTFSARSSIFKDVYIPEDVDMYIDELLVFWSLMHGKVYFISSPLSVWNIHGSNYSGSISNNDKRLEKISRMEKSSSAVLKFLQDHHLNQFIVSLYKLKHTVRVISFKEEISIKGYVEMINFLKFLISNRSLSIKTLHTYNSFQRLIPTRLLRGIKLLVRR